MLYPLPKNILLKKKNEKKKERDKKYTAYIGNFINNHQNTVDFHVVTG